MFSDTTQNQIKAIIDRIERLEEEKAGIASDIKDIYAEAKDHGFDTKILKQVIKLNKLSAEERQTQEALIDSYMSALHESKAA